ncbi:MAG: EamA/RhaT family transporter, partial [Lysobacter sp.]
MTAAMNPESRTALIQLFVAEILIGSVGVFAHEGGQDSITTVFFRCVFGSLFLLAWGIARGHLRGLLAERALIQAA